MSEIVRLLRTDPVTRPVAVVVVDRRHAGRADAARAVGALVDGADHCFGPDAGPDEVAATLESCLARRADLEPLSVGGPTSGPVSWSTAVVLIERMLMGSFRQSVPVGLGLLRLPRDGRSTVDEEIARELRGDDLISRVDDHHLVIALQGVGRRVLLRRLEDLHHRFDLGAAGLRAVGLEFPTDGRSLAQLLIEGREAFSRAEREQAPLVVGADWQPWTDAAPDVMLIDPDPVLAAVLTATLARRGLKVVHRLDAVDAVEELSGSSRGALPRVVLMELDQRGIDGLQVLRRLRDSGATERCKVLVLSNRTQEGDLRRAFELGIDDFVAKPFSTPLLVHRLRRALEG